MHRTISVPNSIIPYKPEHHRHDVTAVNPQEGSRPPQQKENDERDREQADGLRRCEGMLDLASRPRNRSIEAHRHRRKIHAAHDQPAGNKTNRRRGSTCLMDTQFTPFIVNDTLKATIVRKKRKTREFSQETAKFFNNITAAITPHYTLHRAFNYRIILRMRLRKNFCNRKVVEQKKIC